MFSVSVIEQSRSLLLAAGHGSIVSKVQVVPQQGYLPLMEAIWTHKFAEADGFVQPEHVALIRPMFYGLSSLTLCSMPEEVVRLLAAGNLAHAYLNDRQNRRDGELRSYLNNAKLQSLEHPAIFVRIVGDENGCPPTVAETRELELWPSRTRELSDFTASYHDKGLPYDHSKINLVEQAMDKSWALNRTEEDHCSVEGSEDLMVWAKGMALTGLDLKDSDPLPVPMTFTGCAKLGPISINHHNCGHQTRCDRLVQAFFEVFYPHRRYKFHDHVVCIIGEPGQITMAYITIATLTHSPWRSDLGLDVCEEFENDTMTFGTKVIRTVMEFTPILDNWRSDAMRINLLCDGRLGTKFQQLKTGCEGCIAILDKYRTRIGKLENEWHKRIPNGNEDTHELAEIKRDIDGLGQEVNGLKNTLERSER
ncbi:hypothetical protein CC80DRAFT_545412 [Byssothecium circinans]|uniref:Uncharacterized protein n=1 Tax=Byssothecium circinans TaxID=147558 RepID=A0A6A5UAT7_9PLEO|nr:hypothetical protein CC80DRAFT_545412 [Byssothecium circinans]